MLKTDAEHILRRLIDETDAQFSEEQINCLVRFVKKFTERTIEEALNTYTPGKLGSRPSFFTE